MSNNNTLKNIALTIAAAAEVVGITSSSSAAEYAERTAAAERSVNHRTVEVDPEDRRPTTEEQL